MDLNANERNECMLRLIEIQRQNGEEYF